ncbi:Ig-like domain-containing protein, partial [Noviherbaspirillum sp.]|uniref:Ig-like domain-containing protein n=1 Tax=Noviherbaspirillum sp. TaxID=1926288 RepID=UPI002FE18F29
SYAIDAYIYLHNANDPVYTNCAPGTWGYETILHEVGHAMGLDHPFEGNPPLPSGQDNTNNTVMSYTDAGAFKTSYQQYDLLALRWIYGEDGIRGNYGFNSTYGPSLTLAPFDTIAPTISNFSPADEASGVDVASNIVITFNENIQAGTGNIVLKTASGIVVETYNAAFGGNLAFNGRTLTINPGVDLNYGTSYRVEFAAGSVKDTAGNSFAGTTSYNFTTQSAPVDVIAPTVTFFNPADEAKNVGINDNISITFNESVLLGGGTIRLRDGSGRIIETLGASSSNVKVSGNVLTINPTNDFLYNTAYAVQLSAGVVIDASGNSFAGESNYNFTTGAPIDITAPTVSAVSPANNSKNVNVSTNIVVTFSEEMQLGTGSILLKNGFGQIVEIFNASVNSRLTITGKTLSIDPSFDLVPNSRFTLELGPGAVRDLAGNSYAGVGTYSFTTQEASKLIPGSMNDEMLTGGTGDDTISGNAGNDSLVGSAGNDKLDGGEGLDSAIYTASRTNFVVTKTATGVTVSDSSGVEGTDTLVNIERIRFTDQSVAFDVEGNAGKAYRLYKAAFDRVPDLPGLGWQIKAMDNGVSLAQIAQNFIDSPEFVSLYGQNIANANLVTELYRNVLHRQPEAEGFNHWMTILENKTLSRAEVLFYFSESTENQKQTIELIGNGISYIDYA